MSFSTLVLIRFVFFIQTLNRLFVARRNSIPDIHYKVLRVHIHIYSSNNRTHFFCLLSFSLLSSFISFVTLRIISKMTNERNDTNNESKQSASHTHTHVGNREIQINFFKVIIREEVFCGYLINQPIIKCTQSVAGIYQNDN